jgi:hypothetical protein
MNVQSETPAGREKKMEGNKKGPPIGGPEGFHL